MQRHPLALAAALLMGLAPSAQGANPYYRVVEVLPSLPGQEVWAWDLNNNGTVVGHVGQGNPNPAFDSRAFAWSTATGWRELFVGQAYAINDAGSVAGTANGQWLRNNGFPDAQGTVRAVLDGLPLTTPAAADGSFESMAWGLGPAGEVVGFSTTGSGNGARAAVWSGAGAPGLIAAGNESLFSLSSPGPGLVNSAGIVVGRSGSGTRQLATWSSAAGVTLLGAPGGVDTEGLAINDSGQIAGRAGAAAFRWTPGAGFTTLSVAGSPLSWAQSINDQGDVAGWHQPSLVESNYYGARAVVWRANGSLFDVNSARIVERPAGLVFTQVRDINDRGQMLLWGYDSTQPGNLQRAFVMAECLRCGQIRPYPNLSGERLDVGADWFDAYNELDFVNAGTLIIGTAVDNRAGAVIRNDGRLEIRGDGWLLNEGQVLVAASATLDVQARLSNLSSGQLQQRGNMTVSGLVLNNGTWEQQTGRLRLDGGSVSNNRSWVVSGGEFEMQGGRVTNERDWTFRGARLVKDDSSDLDNLGQALFGLNGEGPATVLEWQGRVRNGSLTAPPGLPGTEAIWQMRNTQVTLRNGGYANESGLTALLAGTQFTLSEGSNFFVRGGELQLAPGSRLRLLADAGQIAVSEGALIDLQFGGRLEVASQLVNRGRVDVAGQMADVRELANRGRFDVVMGGDVAMADGGQFLVQDGTVTIHRGGRIHGAASFNQQGGTVVVNGELNTAVAQFDAGVLMGTGVITGTVVMGLGFEVSPSLLLRPGASPGTLTIDGSLRVNRDVEIELELASASVYDRIAVIGDAVIDGARLRLAVDAGFDPELDDRFSFISASGSFAGDSFSFDASALPAGWDGALQQQARALRLWIDNPSVPELAPVVAGSTDRIEAGSWRWTRDAVIEGSLEVAGRLTHRAQAGFDVDTGEPAPAYLTLADTGRLHVLSGGRFTNRSDALMQGALVVDGELQNRAGGTLRLENGLQLAGRLSSDGALQVVGGGRIELAGGATATLAGTVETGVPWVNAGRVEVLGTVMNSGLVELRTGGVLEVADGGHFDSTGWPTGRIFAPAGSVVRVDGLLSVRDDVVGLAVQGGRLAGHGRVEGFTQVAGGTVQPGGAFEVGTLTIAGRLELAAAQLDFDLGRDASDRLDASAALVSQGDGQMSLSLFFDGGAPIGGESWVLLTTGAGSWLDLARIDLFPLVPAFGGGWSLWQPDPALLTATLRFDDGVLSYQVTAVPEPASWLMLVLGLGALGAAAQRRRTAPLQRQGHRRSAESIASPGASPE